MYNASGSGSPSQSGGGYGQDYQTQKSRSDIKNVIPLDLYECMEYASYITTALIVENKVPPRHIKNFYREFYKLFHFVEDLLSYELRKEVRIWFRDMAKQITNTNKVADGVHLYIKFYRELGDIGYVTLYEGVIKPDFETMGIPVDVAERVRQEVKAEFDAKSIKVRR